MTDRHEVLPHHLLRAVLGDRQVRDLLGELEVDPDEVMMTLDHTWLAAADTIDLEEIQAVGIDLPTVLAAINPPFDDPPDWGGRRLADSTRDLLVRALAVRGPLQGARVGSGQLLSSLMASKDPIVAPALRAHGLHTRAARGAVERWNRRAS